MNRRILAAAVLLALAAGAYMLWPRGTADDTLQGYIEGDFVLVGAENAGRVIALSVDSGSDVAAGGALFDLDAEAETAAADEADARLGQAKAELADLQAAGQRPEQIAVLQAAEKRARAALDLSRSDLDRQRALFTKGYSAEARLQQAQATFERDEAALMEARRQITAAELAGRGATINAAEAAVSAAEAGLDGARKALAKRNVKAPVAARVEDVYFRPGEVVAAGQPVLSLLPPGNRKVRFYAPEPRLSSLRLGQQIEIICDGCAAPLPATISFISREAEFTPPVIFSAEERAKLVFRIEARLTNAETLPIGLPIDVRLAEPPR